MIRRRNLPMEMECQTADFWCWAAVAQCINTFSNRVSSQDQIASDHVGNSCSFNDDPVDTPDCGTSPCGGDCNSPHRLSEVLRSQGHAVDPIAIDSSADLTFEDVVRAINQDVPLPLRINIPAGSAGGHFVCVIGYADDGEGNEFVEILDPLVPGKNLGNAEVRNIAFETLMGEYPLRSERGIPNYKYELR